MLKNKLHISSKIRSCFRTELSILSLHMQRTYSLEHAHVYFSRQLKLIEQLLIIYTSLRYIGTPHVHPPFSH